MKKSFLIVAASLLACVTVNQVSAQTQDTTRKTTTTTTTTAPDTSVTGDVVAALSVNAGYSTAAMLVKTANLEPVLKTGGPYTIFAPDNAAFSSLPPGELDSLTKYPVKLAALLKGHIVTGHYSKAEIIKVLTAGKGKATLTTLDGKQLNLSVNQNKVEVTNGSGSTAQVILFDVVGSNGVVNGINGILKMPDSQL
jgi:uncharacterized surface protein with fasciclin (FAS1) repeats